MSEASRSLSGGAGEAGPSGRDSTAFRALSLSVFVGLVYLLVVGAFQFRFAQTDYAHHILMADAFLHGQFHVRAEVLEAQRKSIAERVNRALDDTEEATGTRFPAEKRAELVRDVTRDVVNADWAIIDGRYYGYWAPFTAVVAMPFVALIGVGVSDQVLSSLLGAINIGLFYWLLRRVHDVGLCRMTEPGRIGLTILLAFGTSHFWQVCTSQVWFTVQVVTMMCMLAALIAALSPANTRWSVLLSGVWFGAAILSRNIAIVMGLFFVALWWIRSDLPRPARWREMVVRLLIFAIPIAIAVGLQSYYNYARFGDPLESGLDLQIRTGGHAHFQADYHSHGIFSLVYVPRNLWFYFLNYRLEPNAAADPRIWFDKDGNSLFLVTPPMLYALLAFRRRSPLAWALIAGVGPLLAVLMVYFATGWVQFGPRYLLDAMPLLLLLVALGMRGRLTPVGYVLICLAVAAHLFGTYRLCDDEFAVLDPWIGAWTLPVLLLLALVPVPIWLLHNWRARAESAK